MRHYAEIVTAVLSCCFCGDLFLGAPLHAKGALCLGFFVFRFIRDGRLGALSACSERSAPLSNSCWSQKRQAAGSETSEGLWSSKVSGPKSFSRVLSSPQFCLWEYSREWLQTAQASNQQRIRSRWRAAGFTCLGLQQ